MKGEVWSLTECYAMLTRKTLRTFWRRVLPPHTSTASPWRRRYNAPPHLW